MDDARSKELFLEVFLALPRQGPGNRSTTEQALALCVGLPDAPRILDLGCGTGGQSFLLTEITGGTVTAVDILPAAVRRLAERAAERGFENRVTPLVGDIAHLDLEPAAFDLVWSEGAFYNLGIGPALRASRKLIKPGGWLAFSDCVYRSDDPPAELRSTFDVEYPTMGTAATVTALVAAGGFEPAGHFTLPDEAWEADFYRPMRARITELRGKYAADADALAVMDALAAEPAGYPELSRHVAYEFFVARRGE